MVASILPPVPDLFEYAPFHVGKDTYLASGWFPRERQNRKIESCVRAPVLVLDADLKDWLLAQEVARELCGGDAPSSDRLKAWLYAQPREDVEALLEMARDDLLTILTRVVGQLPTVVTVSGFGHHLTYWLPEDFGFQEDSGPNGLQRIIQANKRLVKRINEEAGFDIVDPAVSDPGTRLLREIGSFNHKNGSPVEVRAVVYEPTRILEALPDGDASLWTDISKSSSKKSEMVEVSGALEVTCADGTMTLADFYDVAKEDEKLKIACPFSDSSTVGAAWLVRGKTCVFLYCSSDHHGHDHRSEGVARWIYRAQVVFERGDEVEIADRLIKDYLGETAVFDQGALYRYLDDGTWRAFVNSEVESMAKGYAGSLVRGAPKNGQPTFKVLRLSHSNCKGVVKVVQETLHHHRFFEEAPPGIGFENGFMRLTDGVMVGHNPDHRLLAAFKLPFAFDPKARCPRWESFLEEVFDGDVDAPEKSAFLQEFCGAALFGKATDFQQHPLLYGPTAANGKSVFIETIGRLFPPDAQCASSPQDWAQPFGKAGLLNARINLVTEMSERELVDSGAMKAIMTGDSILYEQKYKPSFLYRPVAGHIIAVNNLPASLDRSQGFYRRFVVVEFNRTFAPDEQDAGLKKKLLGELPGIAAWAIRGARRRFRAEGYTVPVSSAKAMQEWRLNNDNVALFARTCLSEDPEGEVQSAKLYSRYKIWVLRQGLRPVSQRRFTQELRRTFPTRRRRDGVVWSVSVEAEA